MRIRYSPPSEIELEGTPDQLRELSDAVLELNVTGEGELSLSAEAGFAPSPYATVLTGRRIHIEGERVCISVAEDALIVTGSFSALRSFAASLAMLAEGADTSHIHFEYWDGHPDIAQDSCPLVISVRQSSSR